MRSSGLSARNLPSSSGRTFAGTRVTPAGHAASSLDERLEEVDRHREDRRRVALGAHLEQGLKESELYRDRMLADPLRSLGELLGCLELALGGDDLRPPLALRLSLPRHRPLHRLRDLHVLDLDGRHLYAPRLGLRVDD